MTIKKLKTQLNLTNTDIARMFGYKTLDSYQNAKGGKDRLEDGLCEFYAHILKQKKVEKTLK